MRIITTRGNGVSDGRQYSLFPVAESPPPPATNTSLPLPAASSIAGTTRADTRLLREQELGIDNVSYTYRNPPNGEQGWSGKKAARKKTMYKK